MSSGKRAKEREAAVARRIKYLTALLSDQPGPSEAETLGRAIGKVAAHIFIEHGIPLIKELVRDEVGSHIEAINAVAAKKPKRRRRKT